MGNKKLGMGVAIKCYKIEILHWPNGTRLNKCLNTYKPSKIYMYNVCILIMRFVSLLLADRQAFGLRLHLHRKYTLGQWFGACYLLVFCLKFPFLLKMGKIILKRIKREIYYSYIRIIYYACLFGLNFQVKIITIIINIIRKSNKYAVGPFPADAVH